MNNSKRVKCYVKNGGSSKQCLLNGVQKSIKSSNSRQSANTTFPVNFENFSFHTSGNYWGNSTLTKTKQHHAQSKSPASTPSSTSKKKQNRNSGTRNPGTAAPYQEIREESGKTLCSDGKLIITQRVRYIYYSVKEYMTCSNVKGDHTSLLMALTTIRAGKIRHTLVSCACSAPKVASRRTKQHVPKIFISSYLSSL